MSSRPGPGTIGNALRDAERELRDAGVDNPKNDAEILLSELLGLARGQLWLRSGEPLPEAARRGYGDLIARRRTREPIAYVIGHWPFLELDLRTDRRALVPRPETEDLALLARQRITSAMPVSVADVGTGCGCLALALASTRPGVRVIGIDRDPAALSLAAENVAITGMSHRVGLVCGDLLEPVGASAVLDLIVANLPYVSGNELQRLEPDVRDHEPSRALDGGEGGLQIVRRLIDQVPSRLRDGGRLLAELAPWQTRAVAAALETAGGWSEIEIHRDRFGRQRVVSSRRG